MSNREDSPLVPSSDRVPADMPCWRRCLCNQWGDSITANCRSNLVWNLCFTFFDICSLAYSVSERSGDGRLTYSELNTATKSQ